VVASKQDAVTEQQQAQTGRGSTGKKPHSPGRLKQPAIFDANSLCRNDKLRAIHATQRK
jgi:hypothetical protein